VTSPKKQVNRRRLRLLAAQNLSSWGSETPRQIRWIFLLTMKEKLVVLSGSGISAESGIPTFRAEDGLWAGFRIEDVATPEAWQKDYKKVLEFYNVRRENAATAQPNHAHIILSKLQAYFDVQIITQNVDDLHERAGSQKVMHLHGNLFEARSTKTNKVYPVKNNLIQAGELCPEGAQLRPHIVWFGEAVPLIEHAAQEVAKADYFLIIGTSLQVYPAAGLWRYCPYTAQKFLIDPNLPIEVAGREDFICWKENATTGMDKLVEYLNKFLGEKIEM